MALRWFDGFDWWLGGVSPSGDLPFLYEEASAAADARGQVSTLAVRYGTRGFRINGSSGGSAGLGWVRKTLGGTEATMVCGMAVRPNNNDTQTIGLMGFYEGGVLHTDLRMSTGTSTYDLIATRNGTVLGTASAALLDVTWHYIEVKSTINDATGTYILKVNGVTLLNLSGIDTRNGGTGFIDRFLLGNSIGTNNYTVDYDDLYILDTSGALNNDFLGDVRIAALYPDGAGTTTQWTPSAGSNFQNVDDATPDGDATYNSESTVGELDLYTVGNLPTAAASVPGVKEAVYHRKDDAGPRTLRQVIRTGGVNYEGADIAMTDTYKFTTALRETNPGTGVGWTESEINALEIGQKLQA